MKKVKRNWVAVDSGSGSKLFPYELRHSSLSSPKCYETLREALYERKQYEVYYPGIELWARVKVRR